MLDYIDEIAPDAVITSEHNENTGNDLMSEELDKIRIALRDTDSDVRGRAAGNLPDLYPEDDEKLRNEKLLLWKKALGDVHFCVRSRAAERLPEIYPDDDKDLRNEKLSLLKIALSDDDFDVRGGAARKLPDLYPEDDEKLRNEKLLLWKKALSDDFTTVRGGAVGRLPEPKPDDDEKLRNEKLLLWKIALNDVDSDVRLSAAERLPDIYSDDDKDLRNMKLWLWQMALSDTSDVRGGAAERLPDIYSDDDKDLRNMKLWLWATVLSDDSAGVRWIPSLRLSEFSSDGDDDSNVRDMAPVGQQSKKMKDWGEIRLFFETCGKAGYPKDIQECLENVQLRQYLRWLFVNDHRQDYWLTAEEMGEANEINVSLLEFALSKSINFDWRHEESEENWRALIGLFRHAVPEWMIKGEEIVKGFDLLVENFGYKNAYRYLSRKDLSKHDALFAMEPIILMFKKSGLSKKQFWGNVLNQIVMDGAVYSEGCAQQHINQIAIGTELDLNRVAREAKKYNIPEMNELLKKYSNYAAIFESWPSLRRYADLVSLLGETDALAMLETLGEEKKELSEYVKTLLFHKDSKVSIPAVTEFLNNPDMFLGTDDEHAPKEFHRRKKPSRYSHIPNLDMSGADLRDSLVEGTMDKIQGFTPMRIRYEIPIELIDSEEINTLETNEKMLERFKLIMAKGREDKEARSLFERVETIIGKQNMNGFFEGTFLASEDQWKRIREDHLRISFSGKTVEIEVQVHRKSDPMAAIAGDDTANCMPFGSGKNTVYTFNTNTGLMTVRLKVGDRWKTIAESVLTRDIEVEGLKGKSKETFIWELETNGDRLDLALPEEVLNDGKKVIPILDNIEVAGGYKVPKWQKTIKALYSDFWSEYLNKNGVNLTNEGKIRAGLGYDDLGRLYDGQETTRWIPRAMVSYSDALGPNLGVIKTRNALAEYRKEITGEEQSKTTQTEISERGKRNGVRYAAVDDALAVGWLESRVYNESGAGEFVEGGAAMENMLIATQINNIRRGRPQMSLVHIGEKDEKKEMDGYLMAYEGKLYEGNSEMIRHTTNGVLYIEDMAVRQEAKIGAGAMLAEFMELYKKNYLEKNILMPIYMQARESTSFALVQKQLEKIAVSLGLKIQIIGDTEVTGSDNERHSILLVPQY